MRPHLVLSGELLHCMNQINQLIAGCDIFVAIGTHGDLLPAGDFTRRLKRQSFSLEINHLDAAKSVHQPNALAHNDGGSDDCYFKVLIWVFQWDQPHDPAANLQSETPLTEVLVIDEDELLGDEKDWNEWRPLYGDEPFCNFMHLYIDWGGRPEGPQQSEQYHFGNQGQLGKQTKR